MPYLCGLWRFRKRLLIIQKMRGDGYAMKFGEKLQKLRKENGLSQEQLAEKLNVSRQAISKWEMGTIPDNGKCG